MQKHTRLKFIHKKLIMNQLITLIQLFISMN